MCVTAAGAPRPIQAAARSPVVCCSRVGPAASRAPSRVSARVSGSDDGNHGEDAQAHGTLRSAASPRRVRLARRNCLAVRWGDPVAVEKCVLRDVAVSPEALRARVHAAPWAPGRHGVVLAPRQAGSCGCRARHRLDVQVGACASCCGSARLVLPATRSTHSCLACGNVAVGAAR